MTDAPSDMFGKIMSISDELMWDWYNLLSFRPLTEIAELKAEVANGKNPRDVKILLAKEIIARFMMKQRQRRLSKNLLTVSKKVQCQMKCLNSPLKAKLV